MPIYEDETKRREGRSFFSPSTASKRAKFLSLSLSHSAAIRFRDRGEGHEIEWRKRRRRGGSKMSAASGRRDRSSRRGSHALAPLLAVRWMRRRVPSEPPPACPSDWGRRSSLPPPYSSCPSASSSTAIPLSGTFLLRLLLFDQRLERIYFAYGVELFHTLRRFLVWILCCSLFSSCMSSETLTLRSGLWKIVITLTRFCYLSVLFFGHDE